MLLHSYSSPYRHNYIEKSGDDLSACIRVASIDALNAGYWRIGHNNVICLHVQYAHGMADFLLLPVSSHETLLMHREICDLGGTGRMGSSIQFTHVWLTCNQRNEEFEELAVLNLERLAPKFDG